MRTYIFEWVQRAYIHANSEEEAREKLTAADFTDVASDFELIDVKRGRHE